MYAPGTHMKRFAELCTEASLTRQETSWFWEHLLERTLKLAEHWQEVSREELSNQLQEAVLIMQVHETLSVTVGVKRNRYRDH